VHSPALSSPGHFSLPGFIQGERIPPRRVYWIRRDRVGALIGFGAYAVSDRSWSPLVIWLGAIAGRLAGRRPCRGARSSSIPSSVFAYGVVAFRGHGNLEEFEVRRPRSSWRACCYGSSVFGRGAMVASSILARRSSSTGCRIGI